MILIWNKKLLLNTEVIFSSEDFTVRSYFQKRIWQPVEEMIEYLGLWESKGSQ